MLRRFERKAYIPTAGSRQQRDGKQAAVAVHPPGRRHEHHEVETEGAECECGEEHQARTPLSVHHRLRKSADQQQRDEQGHRGQQKRDDEQRGDQQHGDAEPLVEPLAVEHEQQRAEHDARTGVVLQHDDRQRQADHHAHTHEVPHPRDGEGLCAHHPGQSQRRGDLHELHGCTRTEPNSNHALAPLTSRPNSSAATSSTRPPM